MRVISGIYKGRRLFSPNDDGVRPTSDKNKETIFNILFSMDLLEGATILDLFCGSGGLGIEALSRGGSSAVFADLSQASVELTKKNLAHISADKNSFEVYCADYRLALKKLKGRQFSLIFLDPPYERSLETKAIKLIADFDILASGGAVICEHSAKIDLQNTLKRDIIDFENVFSVQSRRFGASTISVLFRR